jgi:hypothetical protein
VFAPGLVRPCCMAAAADGSVYIGDLGEPGKFPNELPSRVWRMDTDGTLTALALRRKKDELRPEEKKREYDLLKVVAVALSRDESTLYVLDKIGSDDSGGSNVVLYSLALASEEAQSIAGVHIVEPIAMAVDGDGDLLILDRGTTRTSGRPAAAQLVAITRDTTTPAPPRPLTIEEPLCLYVRPDDGALLIGDGKGQNSSAAGNIVAVNRADWTHKPLLPAEAKPADEPYSNGSPLVAPTAVAGFPDGVLYVLDAGLRPLRPRGLSHIRTVAEQACIYSIRSDDNDITPRRVIPPGHLVLPLGMVARADGLLVCDPGPLDPENTIPSRALPHRFAVVTHFAKSRLPSGADSQKQEVSRVVELIDRLVDEHKPAHTIADLLPSPASVRPSSG